MSETQLVGIMCAPCASGDHARCIGEPCRCQALTGSSAKIPPPPSLATLEANALIAHLEAERDTLRAERDAAQQEIEREQAATRQQQESASRLAVALAGRVGELLALQRAATGVVAGATEWWRECPWCRRANYQNAPAHFVDCPLEALRAALSADVETERSDFASFREHHLATEQAWEAEKQVVARLSAQVEQQERANQIIREEGVEARAIIQSRDIEIVKLNRVVDTLRAERDAAQ